MNLNKKITELKENIHIVKNKNFNELARVRKVINTLDKHICRGEVTIIDKEDNLVLQTHYEYFIVYLTEQWMVIRRYDIVNKCEKISEYTNIELAWISEYKLNDTSVRFTGKLDGEFKVSILCVLKEKMEINK